MATSKRTRIFMGFLAGVFLLTSSALTIGIILESMQNSGQPDGTQQESQAPQPEDTLQGTKLSGFTPVKSVPKLKTQDLKQGDGAAAKAGDTVTVDYTGAVAATGIIFQSSKDLGQPVPVTLKDGPEGVITGWVEGVPGMKVGGTRRLLIPADLAYGSQSRPGIPANADLVFDVTLRSIGKPTQ